MKAGNKTAEQYTKSTRKRKERGERKSTKNDSGSHGEKAHTTKLEKKKKEGIRVMRNGKEMKYCNYIYTDLLLSEQYKFGERYIYT